jgi:type IV pilus assembly protein PilX
MNKSNTIAVPARRQRGVVLISTMLLLLVMTIFALSMFRSYGLQEKIAGNVREKQRALQNAESAQQYGETWLSNLTTDTPAVLPCSGTIMVTDPSVVKICSNSMTAGAVLIVPWANAFQYNAPNTGGYTINLSSPQANSFADYPQFYITDLGVSANGWGEIYQVDAWGYASTTGTIAVVESTYLVKPKVPCLSCSTNGGSG